MTNRSNMIPIAGRLHSVAEGNIGMGANEILHDEAEQTMDVMINHLKDYEEYVPNRATPYAKGERCTLFACVWESKIDGNQSNPAVLDGETYSIVPNITDWKKVSGDYEAWLLNKDKPATTGTTDDYPYNGMGRVVLKKNMHNIAAEGEPENIVNILTQDAFEDGDDNPITNTIFVVQYDFVLGENITVPANCVLEFEGGTISNSISNSYKITGTNTKLNLNDYVQVFKSVVLDGTFDITKISVCNFGVVEGSDNASANSDIFDNFVIPSLTNIVVPLLIPEGTFYYSQPLVFNGTYDIICEGSLIYVGAVASTALTIINNGGANAIVDRHFKIKLNLGYDIREYYTESGGVFSIPENYGLVIVGAHGCKIDILNVIGFAYCVKCASNAAGFAYNNITLTSLGGYSYKAMILSASGTGYVNENLFLGGNFINWSSNPVAGINTALTLESTNSHLVNNNVFVKPCIESFALGVYFSKAYYNTIYSGRFEAVTVPMDFRLNSDTRNNVVICGYRTSATGNVENNYVNNNMFVEIVSFADSIYKKLFDGKIKAFYDNSNGSLSNMYSLYYNGNVSNVGNMGGTYYWGFIVDTSKVKTFRISTSAKTTLGVAILDSQLNNITDSATISNYVSGLSVVEGKVYRSSENVTINKAVVTFKQACIYAFIGVKVKNDSICLEAQCDNTFDILYNPADKPLLSGNITPTQGLNLEVGDRMYNSSTNKFYSWNGTSVVEG